jgi:SOS response regulatory protein OraA/RecX
MVSLLQTVRDPIKNRENVSVGFINCEKASDKEERNKLWDTMVAKGFPQQLTRSIHNSYLNTQIIRENDLITIVL